MKAGTVKVVGLDDFRRELKKLDEAGLIADLKEANREVAQLVVDGAQQRADTRLERAAAASLRASRTQARAQVIGGSSKVPFFGGAEFGAGQNAPRVRATGRYVGFNQFKAWTGNGRSAGFFLYPTIRAETDRIVEVYGDHMDRITKKAFPD
jgi:hypothetical protein